MAGTLEEFLIVRPDRSGAPGYVGQTTDGAIDLELLKECACGTLDCEQLEFIEYKMPSGAQVVVIADAQADEKALEPNLSVTEFVQKYHDPDRTVRGTVLLFRNKCWENDE